MKKINLILMQVVLICLIGIGLVMAANGMQDGTGVNHDAVVAAGGQNGEGVGIQAKSGEYLGEDGKIIRLQAKENNRFRLQVGNASANCTCNMTQEKIQNKTKFYAKMSNGQNAEIKVMPDTASETALARLRLKVCNENCSIELKETGNKLVYELKTQRQSKVFGLFKKQMQVETQVNAENGEIVRTNKPWWAFLASEKEE